jgi:FtsH-binding integral membrane protein
LGCCCSARSGLTIRSRSDNVDFKILEPLPLAVTLVMVTALLFGVTFAALAARIDHRMGLIADRGWKSKSAHLSLIALVFLMAAIVYVVVRVIARGRIGDLLKHRPIRLAGHALVLLAATAAAIAVLRTTAEIL